MTLALLWPIAAEQQVKRLASVSSHDSNSILKQESKTIDGTQEGQGLGKNPDTEAQSPTSCCLM